MYNHTLFLRDYFVNILEIIKEFLNVSSIDADLMLDNFIYLSNYRT
jgi:hypothetical protein